MHVSGTKTSVRLLALSWLGLISIVWTCEPTLIVPVPPHEHGGHIIPCTEELHSQCNNANGKVSVMIASTGVAYEPTAWCQRA